VASSHPITPLAHSFGALASVPHANVCSASTLVRHSVDVMKAHGVEEVRPPASCSSPLLRTVCVCRAHRHPATSDDPQRFLTPDMAYRSLSFPGARTLLCNPAAASRLLNVRGQASMPEARVLRLSWMLASRLILALHYHVSRSYILASFSPRARLAQAADICHSLDRTRDRVR
jgi:hypothetical protein